MKRKLITAAIFLALAVAMGLAVYFNIPQGNNLVAHNSVTSSPQGLAMPSQGTDDKFRVASDLPKSTGAATNAPPAASAPK